MAEKDSRDKPVECELQHMCKASKYSRKAKTIVWSPTQAHPLNKSVIGASGGELREQILKEVSLVQ